MKDIKIGSYVRLTKDHTQIYRVFSFDKDVVVVYDTNKVQQILNISEIEIGDDDDMISFDQNSVIYNESDI
ncbi:hypothetical protein NXY11_15675 [Parabacteroides faecis]|uniref:hypothetical protein n=1 Tax=Parabacteroides faecis TaxID=1217282 RepID=UPI0021641C4A|nr:hypothetical protein [Parabacteroides faecis]MCS2891751.1 hypothetical protein [Parabacteroides faecis]UVQ44635.1 hypothetical protein NXY11_15675 [Parabacteroides faecis]